MNINLLVNTLNIFFHNFNKGLNGTTVECTFVAWGLIFTGLCTCTCFSDCQQTTTARFFSSVIVKGSCVRKQDGAQWNVYQFALMADALRKKRKKKAQSLTEANHLPHPPTHDYLHTHTHTHKLARLTGIFLVAIKSSFAWQLTQKFSLPLAGRL